MSTSVPDRPFITGGPLLGRSPRGAVAIGVVLLAALIPVPGLYTATGGTMEEGFMLYFPELVKQGKVPNVDFLHLYGPGALHVLAGWYEVFGNTLAAERTFGLLQNLGIIFAVYAIVRPWGRIAAAGAGVVAVIIIMTAIGLQAMAWHGALALGLWTVVFAVRARHLNPSAHRWLPWAATGLLAGLALSYRPDAVIGIGLAVGVVAWRDKGDAYRPLLGGAAVGLIPMWIHIVMAGIGPSIRGMVLDPVFELRPGRELPSPPSWNAIDGFLLRVVEFFPPWWELPALGAPRQLFLWFFGMIAAAIAIPAWAWWRRRRGDDTSGTLVLLAAGLFALGILGQGLQRPDSTHMAWVTIASWPLLVPVVIDVVRTLRPSVQWRSASVSAIAAVAVLMFVVCPFYTYRQYVLATRVTAGDLPDPFPVNRDDKTFYFGDIRAADSMQQAIDDLDQWSRPGESLIVGPYDLSRTYYSESFVYWMFPELEAGTYFIEMDPGVADAPDSGLAEEVADADWVLLTRYWVDWNEPNISGRSRSQAPNEVIADRFCLVGNYVDAYVTLYRNCGPGNGVGVSPAEVDGTTPAERVGAR
ncbi:MAG: hypothetical protein H0X61_04345 [Acidimicrobiia bacterium]|nr:hypothetical protein [Acidimicrobiia bacterium]MDQ3389714.1 hypothetical protein [Actinomycetota bacterium]